MSLVRSASSFENRELYSLKVPSGNSGLPASIFNSDEQHGMTYSTNSSSSESYDPKFLIDSPSEENTPASISDILGHSFSSPDASSYQIMDGPISFSPSFIPAKLCDADVITYESEYFGGNDSLESLQYDEETVRLKFLELEQVLFDDHNSTVEDDLFGPHQHVETDVLQPFPNQNVILQDSPRESSSSDSNVSSISSNKEVHVSSAPETPKQLLFSCAAAIQDGKMGEASKIINELRQSVSIQGDPAERIAAYMVEALAARMAISGKGLYKALKCKEPPSSDRLSAMQVLFEVCPCFRFGFMAANGAICDAIKGEQRVHIIDFDINQGSQYYTLLQTLARLPHKPAHLKVTGIDDPESVQRPVGGLNTIGKMLELLAEDLKIPFEFRAVAAETADITPAMLKCQPGDALIVNFAFQLHHMPDESVSIVNQRDQLLRMVKSLNPKLVTVVEQDINTNTAPFLPRFAEAYSYYSAVFESLDATLPKNSQERINVERQCLARDIINIVACEGEERIERYEVAGKWRARMMMAGFKPSRMSQNVKDEIHKLIKQYSDRYKVKEESSALHFGWEEKTLIVASAWK